MNIALYLIIGLIAGVLSGILGIGGGIIVIPSLILVFGLSQQSAQGTTLAMMIPPIGLLAAWVYYKSGHVNLPMAIFIGLGFFLGAFFGAKLAVSIPGEMLKKIFGVALLLISINIIFSK
ncbi:TSUP family transporter [Elusimicrobiota bacterium]